MAIKKGLLKNNTNPDGYYPYTQTDCVFDENGDSLETIMVKSVNGVSPDSSGNVDTMDLLWTNPSPSSAMGTNVVNIDLSSYRFVYILFRAVCNASTPSYVSSIMAKGCYGSVIAIASNALRARWFTVNASNVDFGTGYSYTTYNGNPTADTYMCVPEYIYGIK